MQLIERFLSTNKKKPQDNKTIASITSTIKNKKKAKIFKHFCWNKKKQPGQEKEKMIATESQELLTQCIETALYLSPTTRNNNNKRWSMIDTTSIQFSTDEQAQPQPRQRKLSLPPQYSNIGYLASIPEVDSITE